MLDYLSSAFQDTSPAIETSALRQEFNGSTYRIAGMGLGMNTVQPDVAPTQKMGIPGLGS